MSNFLSFLLELYQQIHFGAAYIRFPLHFLAILLYDTAGSDQLLDMSNRGIYRHWGGLCFQQCDCSSHSGTLPRCFLSSKAYAGDCFFVIYM